MPSTPNQHYLQAIGSHRRSNGWPLQALPKPSPSLLQGYCKAIARLLPIFATFFCGRQRAFGAPLAFETLYHYIAPRQLSFPKAGPIRVMAHPLRFSGIPLR
jgi:hypothetical protein